MSALVVEVEVVVVVELLLRWCTSVAVLQRSVPRHYVQARALEVIEAAVTHRSTGLRLQVGVVLVVDLWVRRCTVAALV